MDSTGVTEVDAPSWVEPALFQGLPIVMDFTQKEVTIFRHAMPVGVELNVGNPGVQDCNFFGMHQRQQPSMEKVLPVEAKFTGQLPHPVVLSLR